MEGDGEQLMSKAEIDTRPPCRSVKKATVELKVGMSCQGCVGAVKRVLGKLEGVESFDIDLEKQKVTVKGNVQPDVVIQSVSKTGKVTSFWESPAAAQAPPAEPESKPKKIAAAACVLV